ncbi:MAG: lipopolysaccharide heptosyltransferase II [Candidatus Omnitrophica bacterium]|nr:lipopolysaccharide heptosyltransferase II [Candidatus Omnitrophota bacterium]
MSPMNILQILPQLESGGVERGTIDLAQALISKGHKAIVVSAGGRLVVKLESIGAIHYMLPVHKKSLFSVLWCAAKLVKIINKEKVDIVHARSRVPAWVSFFAISQTKATFITTCHGYYSKHFFSKVMGWGKRVIVISQIIGRYMATDFHVSKERMRLIYRGVDLNQFKLKKISDSEPNKDRKTIGIIGRITPLKGHIHFIKALPGIFSEFPHARALIVGEAPSNRQDYFNELKFLVDDLNLKNKVEFLGNVKNIPQVLEKLDVLVLATTTEEAFGRVIIEAGAVGVPVVATRVGGVVEIIENENNGLLVDPSNPYEISQAVLRFLKDSKLAKKCVKSLHEKVVDSFSLESMVLKTIEVYNETIEKKRILIIKFGALGDVILISAALKAIREKFPDAYLSLLVKNEFKSIVQRCPYLDNLIVLKKKGWLYMLKQVKLIKKKDFDLSLDFQNNNLSHLISFAAGIKQRFGYRNKKLGFLLNKSTVFTKPDCDPVTHQFKMLEKLDIHQPSDKKLEIWIAERDKEYIDLFLKDNWLNKNQPLIGINPFASQRWVSKSWVVENYAKLADMLSNKYHARIVFTGTANDKIKNKQIIALTSCKPINAAGKTSIMELAAIIERCSVFISVDSAPLHISAAVNTPFVALFGPTDPTRHLPYSKKFALICKNLECSPCYRAKCFRKSCMLDITVDEVFEAACKLLNK